METRGERQAGWSSLAAQASDPGIDVTAPPVLTSVLVELVATPAVSAAEAAGDQLSLSAELLDPVPAFLGVVLDLNGERLSGQALLEPFSGPFGDDHGDASKQSEHLIEQSGQVEGTRQSDAGNAGPPRSPPTVSQTPWTRFVTSPRRSRTVPASTPATR